MILTGKYETAHVHLFLLLCYIDQGHSSSKPNESKIKPRRKVIGLDEAIKDRFFAESGLKKGVENHDIFV